MKILYANEECENIEDYYSVFIAGPTVRNNETKSWRPDLINELSKLNPLYFKNTIILSPECRNDIWLDNYDNQISWEQKHLEIADLLIFWVPRELNHMPAFTTNIEFGMYINDLNKDVIYGRPENSPKNKYLDYCYDKFRNKKPVTNLEAMALQIINYII